MILGISGYGSSGKDEFFRAAERFKGYAFKRSAFADPLKRITSELLDVPIEYFYDRILKGHPLTIFGYEFTPDQACIKVGTEVGRNLHPDIWVRKAMKNLPPDTIFTDCRFPNEARAIVEHGGIVVRVERPGVGPRIDMNTGKPHISDVALDDWPFDFILHNATTLEAYQSAVFHTVNAAERLLRSRAGRL